MRNEGFSLEYLKLGVLCLFAFNHEEQRCDLVAPGKHLFKDAMVSDV